MISSLSSVSIATDDAGLPGDWAGVGVGACGGAGGLSGSHILPPLCIDNACGGGDT